VAQKSRSPEDSDATDRRQHSLIQLYIAQTTVQCMSCGQWTGLWRWRCLHSRTLIEDDGSPPDVSAFVFDVTELPESGGANSVADFLLSFGVRRGGTRSLAGQFIASIATRWVNDDELHCEPGGFMPADQKSAGYFALGDSQAFEAVSAGYAVDQRFFVHNAHALTQRSAARAIYFLTFTTSGAPAAAVL